MSHNIVITDLNNPQYTDFQKAALDYGKTLNLDFSVDAILNKAKQDTGLSDFGSDDFLSRLTLLVNEWSNDDGLSNIGRLSLINKLSLFARNRLLIHQQLQQHPEIHSLAITKPIIVLGLPRSGTTHLLNLLAADNRLQSLPLWESYEPVAMPNETLLDDGTEPRYQRCADQWAMMQQATPHLAAMHPMNPDHIHEELELMGPDFASYNFEWLSPSPQWRDHYYQTDQTPHYQYMKTVLKLLQWQRGFHSNTAHSDNTGHSAAPRWALKCPQHLEQIPALLKTFPDATFVVTHRDPVAVIQSTITMLAYGQRMNRTHVESQALLHYWWDRIEHLLRACVRDRALLPETQSIDVPFSEFMIDDLAMIKKIYSKANLTMNNDATDQLQQYLQQNPRGKSGRMQYNLEGDFSISAAQVRERFQFYFDAFPINIEN